MIRLEALGPRHVEELLARQDEALVGAVIGRAWTSASLRELASRAARWRPDGPLRQYVAIANRAGATDACDAGAYAVDPAAKDGPDRAAHGRGPDGARHAGAIVGGAGLRLLGPGLERGEADASYWVLASHRGRGLGSAIGQALVERAREDPRIRTLVLRIAPENLASQAVARGLGARSVGRMERHPADARRAVERWELGLR